MFGIYGFLEIAMRLLHNFVFKHILEFSTKLIEIGNSHEKSGLLLFHISQPLHMHASSHFREVCLGHPPTLQVRTSMAGRHIWLGGWGGAKRKYGTGGQMYPCWSAEIQRKSRVSAVFSRHSNFWAQLGPWAPGGRRGCSEDSSLNFL